MGRFTAYDQNGRMVADFDKSEYDFLCRYGRTPEEVLDENAKLRKLVSDMWEACPTDGYYCIYHCEHYDRESESHCKLEARMAELGIEVSE